MRNFFSLCVFVALSTNALSQTNSTPTPAPPAVHKTENTETININHNVKPELIKDRQDFCGVSPADCKKQCQDWLSEQKKNLGKNIRTSHCSSGRTLYGKEEAGCSNVLCTGEISYILK